MREEAQSKKNMMRDKAVKDLTQYNTEVKELERIISHEFYLKEFMSAKCSERTEEDRKHEVTSRHSKTFSVQVSTFGLLMSKT